MEVLEVLDEIQHEILDEVVELDELLHKQQLIQRL